jgi:SH3-like domain-containing protein
MSATRAVAGAILALGAGVAIAQTEGTPETQYVIEQLVVSVNAAPDGAGDRVDQIKSGDRVEVLEQQGEQSRVKLASGQEGWVRTSYLSTTPPLREQLKARTDELEKLRAEKTKLETALASAKKAASAATAAPSPTAASAPAPRTNDISGVPPSGGPTSDSAASDAPPPSNPPMFGSDAAAPSRPSWLVAITVSMLTLVAGFVLGWRVLDKRIRAKYGGLRIY